MLALNIENHLQLVSVSPVSSISAPSLYLVKKLLKKPGKVEMEEDINGHADR